MRAEPRKLQTLALLSYSANRFWQNYRHDLQRSKQIILTSDRKRQPEKTGGCTPFLPDPYRFVEIVPDGLGRENRPPYPMKIQFLPNQATESSGQSRVYAILQTKV